MNKNRTFLLLALLTFASCLSQSAPPSVRWFLPPTLKFEPESGLVGDLRVLPVLAGGHLRSNMVWRLSLTEVFIDEREKWAAPPTELVHAAAEGAFFETGAFAVSEDLSTPTLAIDVRSFEGAYADPDVARVSIFAVYTDDMGARQRTFTCDIPLETREPDALAEGIGRALQTVVTDARAWVISGP